MNKTLKILFGQSADLELTFELTDSPVTDLWLERMSMRHQWPLDDPARFYGFGSSQEEQDRALNMIWECISVINNYQPIIDRTIESVNDQDTLNYLHHIFEVYHGLLDSQNTDWWLAAPKSVQHALAQLNIAVHRCESVKFDKPRFVCTWFGMPKTKRLTQDLFEQCGTLDLDFGGVYLNYVEIGKTFLDLATDNDQYIADEAFKPFEHYSADFVVYLFDKDPAFSQYMQNLISRYYENNKSFFQQRGINGVDDYRVQPLKFKVAQLQYDNREKIIEMLRTRQYVSEVKIT